MLAAACGGSAAVTEVTGPGELRCQTTVSTPPSSFPAAGNRVTLTVTAARECTWSASSEASWVEVSPTNGQGEASITLTVAENPEGRSRTGAILVNDNRLSLSQDAAPCRYEVTPPTMRLSHDGGRAAFRVTATAACEWRVSSSEPWVRVLNSSGSSNGTAEADVTENDTGSPRSASLAIADRRVTIAQEPAPAPTPNPSPNPNPNPNPNPGPNPNPNPTPPCVVSLDSSDRSFPADGGDGSFRVNVADGCRWSASSNANWVDITGPNDGTGSDTVRYRVDENRSSSSRNAAITVSGQTHTVRQDGAPQAPPPGDGERVSLSGRAFFVDGSCPNLTFLLEFRRVFTTGDTNFRGNCRSIRSGTALSVEGRLQPDGRVRATRVENRGDDDDDDN
jgi:hypothetical protein